MKLKNFKPDRFIEQCEKNGIKVVANPNGHWRLYGQGLIVNYYPKSQKRSAYINGAVKGKENVQPDEAIRMALGAYHGQVSSLQVNRRPNAAKVKRLKTRLMQEHPYCRYCRIDLNHVPKDEIRLDHVIPVAKGGSNRADNLRLACIKCDRAKANKLPDRGRKIIEIN